MPSSAELSRVESARYALLRRIALAMRHHMVVHLQPMSMVTELLERRLQAGQAEAPQVRDAMEKIHAHSRAAVGACLDVVSWLAPPPDAKVPLDQGVEECLALLRGNFNFRGFPLDGRLGGVAAPVPRSAVRHVLPALLLALTDRAPAPADVVVESTADGVRGVVTVEVRAKAGDPGFPANHPYRLLQWHEVEVLAAADDVEVTREGDVARLAFRIG